MVRTMFGSSCHDSHANHALILNVLSLVLETAAGDCR
jgi:hypothetical protein